MNTAGSFQILAAENDFLVYEQNANSSYPSKNKRLQKFYLSENKAWFILFHFLT